MKWIDSRLIIDFPNSSNPIILDNSWTVKIWTPDIYFDNANSISIINQLINNEFLIINQSNYISYNVRINGIFYCKMDLTNYPQDYQLCNIDIISSMC
jgi:hypothetical protein